MKNKDTILIYLFIMVGGCLLLTNSCKKDEKATLPELTTSSVSNIKTTTVTCGGNITNTGGASITTTANGVCWSTSQNPTTANNKTTDNTGLGIFSSSITGLLPATTYYFRTYATNTVGTAYGNQETATTMAGLPTINTTPASAITTTTITCGGNITDDGGSPVIARGVYWDSGDSKTTDGAGSGSFTSILTGLTPGSTYVLYAYATNSVGTVYGDEITFTTNANLPSVTTKSVTLNTVSSATVYGKVTSDGGGAIIVSGVCWSANPNPTITNEKTTDGSYDIKSSITGLATNTTYYVRAYATNSAGTSYGEEKTFILYLNSPGEPVYDIDGNLYHTVKIGTQTWMVENLKSTHYANGLNIDNITANSEWDMGQGYCWYNNNISYKNIYGALYSYWLIKYADVYGGICPVGWHISSDADWSTLTAFLGVEAYDGGKMKEIGTTHWLNPNTGATNQSGFTALPGGGRASDGSFSGMGYHGYWWTGPQSEGFPNYTAWCRNLSYSSSNVFKYSLSESIGMSVRCVKD